MIASTTAPPPCCAAYDALTGRTETLLLLRPRLERALELVDAVATGTKLGVHLSGPNGVGKSTAAMLAYFLCAARRLPAVYIARAESWVEAARHENGGDAFLLDAMWRQNADLIIAHPGLRSVFQAALRGDKSPFTFAVMDALRKQVGTPALRGFAVIVDEVQHITKSVEQGRVPNPAPEVQRAGEYFATSWHDWTNDNMVFQRMTCASAHAKRDTNLPDGEQHRLRIVEPLDPADRDALQNAAASPAYVRAPRTITPTTPNAREYVVSVTGNILRKLITAASLLPRDCDVSEAQLHQMWHAMWDAMVRDCRGWLSSLDGAQRERALHTVMDVVSGKVRWSSATALYDTGIVYRSAASEYVQPISMAAGAVLLHVVNAHTLSARKPLSSISDGAERGYELQRQVLARLDGFDSPSGVPTKLLDGTPAPSLDLRCSYSLPFSDDKEVVARDVPVLYRPVDPNYPCDAILMPAASDATARICFIECSVTDPLHSNRVTKVQKWFAPTGVVTRLGSLSGRPATVVLVYDGLLRLRAPSKLPRAARALSMGQQGPPLSADSTSLGMEPLASEGTTKHGRKRGAPGTRAEHLGDVTRVVDRPSLADALFVLVGERTA